MKLNNAGVGGLGVETGFWEPGWVESLPGFATGLGKHL